MSSKKRLNRLGLSHLTDKPDLLKKEINNKIKFIEKKNQKRIKKRLKNDDEVLK